MKEIDFYNEFSQKFIKYLRGYIIDTNTSIAYSANKTLDKMIDEISSKLDARITFNDEYIPKLKLDILFGIKRQNKVHLILFEAKYLRQLSLKDYSQLSGYLQVAKNIKTGILLLIIKGDSPNKLSNDFNEIIKLDKLPMDWTQIIVDNSFKYRTGILTYQPNNGIDWIDTSKIGGISTFNELYRVIETEIK